MDKVSAGLAHIVLLVALLAGWQSALLHPIDHVDQQGQFVHPTHDHSDTGRNSDSSAQLCDALAALTACVFAATSTFAVDPSAEIALALRGLGPLLVAAAPPFFAQAPPTLL